MPSFETIIGLEVHAQLQTKSKMFCGCSTRFGSAPNTQVCPVCLGLPGALPVVNVKAVEAAVKMGLATGCTVARRSVFARKNYFYPDCPKNYQISQYEHPLCSNGFLHVEGGEKRIGITRVHLEEDAGKLIHLEGDDHSYADMNRVGVPLIEIVSEPDIRSPRQAASYMQKLRTIVRYLEICDGNMEEGSLRCDVNVSLRKKGSDKFGTKTEVKNLNSFKAVEQALEFEIERQARLLGEGRKIQQDTLLWDSVKGESQIMRSKEEAHDYRYFPEPDLLVLDIPESLIQRVDTEIPELPDAKLDRFVSDLGLPKYDAEVLTSSREIAGYFEATAKELGDAKAVSNWVMGEVLRELKDKKIDISQFKILPRQLAALIAEVQSGGINMPTAKDVFRDMAGTGNEAKDIIEKKGLKQISDEGALDAVVVSVLDNYPQEVAKYLAGKDKLLKFLVGQVMKETRGKAHPQKATDLLKEALEKRRGS
ncbi:MAG: Asp-tRNA(Asn)/Glu-tRNA(Gln) amidotransferase subunit GatB [Candidatus Krumholzibacteria bacterium]|nr:Asp-tRNA(Asn)/Glu-tRNA(Gln) amidotransferase subunit GatB [Candidatus Krumholzibacteria bacterium]